MMRMLMRNAVSCLALCLVLAGTVVFAEDDSIQKGIKEVNRGATEVGHAIDSAARKGRDEVNKAADKAFKKKGKDKKEKKDKKDDKKEEKK